MKRPSVPFGALQLGVGISVAGALLVYMRLLHWIPAVTEALGGLGSWPRAVALMFGVSATVLLLTTLLFGAQFPFVARAVVDSVDTVGRRIAVAYTLNTLGSILGAVAIGFFLLPAIGMGGSFLVLIGLNLAIGAALIISEASRRTGLAAGALAAAGLAAAIVAIPSEPFKQVFLERYGKLLMYREQVTDTVMVTEDAERRTAHPLRRRAGDRGHRELPGGSQLRPPRPAVPPRSTADPQHLLRRRQLALLGRPVSGEADRPGGAEPGRGVRGASLP